MNGKKLALEVIKNIESNIPTFTFRLFYFCIGFGLSNIYLYPKTEKFARNRLMNLKNELESFKKKIKFEEKQN